MLKIVERLPGGIEPSSAEVSRLEATLGAVLPDDYLEFLSCENGGRPEPSTILFQERGQPTTSQVQCFFGVSSVKTFDVSKKAALFRERIPAGFLPIACDPLGNLFLLCLRGSEPGSVWFWDHEKEGGSGLVQDLSRIARSFSEFTDSLT